MKLLALDQSSRCTGYAIFENNKLIDYGTFTLEDQDVGKRLIKFKQKILNLIQLNNIEEIIFEDIQLQNNVMNNVQTFKILAEIFGVLHALVTELSIPYTVVLASSWKSTLNIKGKDRSMQKKNAQNYVIENYGIKPTQDACDAICIGAHYIAKEKEEINWAF